MYVPTLRVTMSASSPAGRGLIRDAGQTSAGNYSANLRCVAVHKRSLTSDAQRAMPINFLLMGACGTVGELSLRVLTHEKMYRRNHMRLPC